jgi:hypothetical protein
MPQEKIGIAQHPFAIVALPVEKDYRVAVAVIRNKAPRAESRSIFGGDRDVVPLSVFPIAYRFCEGHVSGFDRLSGDMERTFNGNNADRSAGDQPHRGAARNPESEFALSVHW